jgi:hypothetical protein
MAQIQKQTITITLSKLVKTGDTAADMGPEGFEAALEAVVTELVDDGSVIVEVDSLTPPTA